MTPGSAPSRSARIIKYTYACVRIEHGGTVLVIDPGIWSEPSALHGADAVLITHEHADHIDVLRLAGLGVPVYADEPACANYGYLIDDRIYHPGDALVVPEQPVQTLFVPLHASWLKTAEAIGFLRAVQPERAFGIHDAQINSRGRQAINSWLTDQGGYGYRYLPPGESADG